MAWNTQLKCNQTLPVWRGVCISSLICVVASLLLLIFFMYICQGLKDKKYCYTNHFLSLCWSSLLGLTCKARISVYKHSFFHRCNSAQMMEVYVYTVYVYIHTYNQFVCYFCMCSPFLQWVCNSSPSSPLQRMNMTNSLRSLQTMRWVLIS